MAHTIEDGSEYATFQDCSLMPNRIMPSSKKKRVGPGFCRETATPVFVWE